jgi:eukaryotic-like serine/threonine-protein kinase
MLDTTHRTSLGPTGRLSAGTRLGPYEISDFIGAGGMGEVYRAHDTHLNRIVALKLLPPDVATDDERRRRFELEARIASALNHPAIVTIYDAGQIGPQPYISMELVAGDTLREILEAGAIPLRRALRIASQLADGLAKAHEAGLVHRDLKPENIKVSGDGFAKILDFGLAKRIAEVDPELLDLTRPALRTSPGMVIGTAGYMSPEQASGGSTAFPSDQFSFGAILYEMLTGRRAFDRPTFAETLSAVIREDLVPIAQLNPGIPAPVRWIVDRCLAKDPNERYALTRDMARDLASVREHLLELLASRRSGTTRRTAGVPCVAVLPVSNLSNSDREDSLADAMTEALVTELTQRRGIRVISSASSTLYKGRRNAVSDIADELDVEWVVLASIAKAGRAIRITAQLVDAASDENRWAHSYTHGSRNVLDKQTEIAAAIACEVAGVLAPEPGGGTRPAVDRKQIARLVGHPPRTASGSRIGDSDGTRNGERP